MIFAAVASPHAVAVCGVESTWYPFAFDCRHQMVDAEIGLGAFVRGEAAGGAVTVAAAGCCCRCDLQSLQLSNGGQNLIVLRGDGRGQCLHHDGASGCCSGHGAEAAVKLLHKGRRGDFALTPICSCRGGGCDSVDKDGGVFISEGVSAARYQSRLPFKSRVEGGGG